MFISLRALNGLDIRLTLVKKSDIRRVVDEGAYRYVTFYNPKSSPLRVTDAMNFLANQLK